jgi:rhamnose utilization protein RhaD (predicted bifunctional aldolase and dehydrogenase)
MNYHHSISQLCTSLGKDRLLVQGAGGNVSWKEDGVLWVKGSGTWLAKAEQDDIFVPVDLHQLQIALAQKNFDVKPQVIATQGKQLLRPSIETILHALMPHKIVVHLHAIDALSYLITKDCEITLRNLIAQSSKKEAVKSIFVGYHRPGPALAQAIYTALQTNKNANVVLLKNHGIVIGGQSIEEVEALLQTINAIFMPTQNPEIFSKRIGLPASRSPSYVPFANQEAHALALTPDLFKRLQTDWVLYPDHAVFLGAKSFTYPSWAAFMEQETANPNSPELIFIENAGVFVKPSFNQAKIAQLLCYFDVISRVLPTAILDPLDQGSIEALLNWDAEKLRQQMAK